jgi:hypothetical protein
MADDTGSSFFESLFFFFSFGFSWIDLKQKKSHWIPACAGMTSQSLGAKVPGLRAL